MQNKPWENLFYFSFWYSYVELSFGNAEGGESRPQKAYRVTITNVRWCELQLMVLSLFYYNLRLVILPRDVTSTVSCKWQSFATVLWERMRGNVDRRWQDGCCTWRGLQLVCSVSPLPANQVRTFSSRCCRWRRLQYDPAPTRHDANQISR